jgi:hypothetical protein
MSGVFGFVKRHILTFTAGVVVGPWVVSKARQVTGLNVPTVGSGGKAAD